MTNNRLILSRLKSGDKTAYTLIFREYYPHVRAFLRKILGSPSMAEEFAQEVFFRLWVGHEKIDCDLSIRSYLFTISKNVAIDHMRHQKSRERYLRWLGDEINDHTDHEHQELMAELWSLVEKKVERMPEKQRVVFTMSRTEGLTNDEIAARLNVSKRTVEKHISNSLKQLREETK